MVDLALDTVLVVVLTFEYPKIWHIAVDFLALYRLPLARCSVLTNVSTHLQPQQSPVHLIIF